MRMRKCTIVAVACLLALNLTGCKKKPLWEEAYDKCKAKFADAATKVRSETKDSSEAASNLMVGVTQAMGDASCELLRQLCQEDQFSESCKKAIQDMD